MEQQGVLKVNTSFDISLFINHIYEVKMDKSIEDVENSKVYKGQYKQLEKMF